VSVVVVRCACIQVCVCVCAQHVHVKDKERESRYMQHSKHIPHTIFQHLLNPVFALKTDDQTKLTAS